MSNLLNPACIDKIYSVSVVTGTSECNAKCKFCAGRYLREQAKPDSIYYKNLESAIKLCARYGGWSLSLTGSGEPTCSPQEVTKVLKIYNECANQGAYFPNVNLFTNGILIGDEKFCASNLHIWRGLGLNNIALSVHSVDEKEQALFYGIREYPNFNTIKQNVEDCAIGVRCTLLLNKNSVNDAASYERAVTKLADMGFKNITSWAVCNPDGSRCDATPSRMGMASIRYWLWRNAKLCHGHSWGGGVYDWNGNILRLTDYVTKHNPHNNFVRQLVVFQDGTVAYSWIRDGALCMK